MSWVGIIALVIVVVVVALNFRGFLYFCQVFFPTFLRKLPIALATLWFVATMVFFGTKLIGDDTIMTEGRIDERVIQTLREKYGLDDPIHVQYVKQVGRLLVFDTMPSRQQRNKTFRDILADHFPYSAALGWRAVVLALAFGVPIGMICALYHNRLADQGGTALALIGVSVPNFIIASLAVFFLSRKWQWFKATEWEDPLNMWIPAAALGAFPFAAILRLTRSSMLEALNEDYVRTARAKGVSEFKVIARHTLRNALSPVVTVMGPITAAVLTGSLVVEQIFVIPGMGDMFVKSVQNRDLPLILGVSVFYCALLVFMNLIVDSLYPVLNPRLRK